MDYTSKLPHPAYLGHAHTLPENDPRISDFLTQFNTEGFDDTYFWCLDTVIAKFIGQLLIRFSEYPGGSPHGKTLEEWSDECRKHGEYLLEYGNYDGSYSRVAVSAMEHNVEEALNFVVNNFFRFWN